MKIQRQIIYWFESNIFRIFSCFDKGNLVVLFNGFQKKTQKTPKNEIELALKLKDARKETHMTQEQLAEKVGKKKLHFTT